MISPSDLHAFIDKIDGGTQGVDLVKIGQQFCQHQGSSRTRKMRVALDIESCLDRFYGGYYSDWACGGQFNRCFEFVQLLVMTFKSAQIDVVVFFDGTLKENKKMRMERNDVRQRTISVLKHIRMIGTPPPKIWWVPPSGLRVCLRNALRSLEIPIVQTIHDHTMEVIDYFNEHKLNAIIGLNSDYIIGNVSRYFSSHDIRLSYKGALETKEFMTPSVLTSLQISQEQLAFVAVLLGGYILIDEPTLKVIYQKINVEFNQDFEARIRQLANIVRPIPAGSSVEDAIKLLKLEQYMDIMKESIEYYQRKGTFCGKRYLGNKKKPITEIVKNIDIIQETPMASETNENDEIANKILKNVSKIVDDADNVAIIAPQTSQEVVRKCVKFVYSLPAEVLRTSYQRHQRGSMDARIYILLTKKEILLPQILEDEQYREMTPIHIFYRPARQMIYAILFNLYHQKFMCSKTKDNLPTPEVIINEWIWSPQNEYNKADEVFAIQLPWAVPTIQRLWFGTTLDDKHRRMRAFLTVMRSDTAIMLNRNFVPAHLMVLACVLRYIVTSPERNIISRHEIDAFLVTAFSPQLGNVEYTQEMVLPGVYLRGVYLATLFMQGVETAALANDACGVPLPWNMTNPWLFFDGKLFHLKLRMSVCLQNLRELCDENLDMVMKIERCKKAIFEDIENLVPQNEPIFRQVYPYSQTHPQYNNKNMQIPIFAADGYKYGYMQQSSMQQQMLYNANMAPYATQRIPKNQQMMPGPNVNQKGMQQRGCAVGGGNFQRNNGYQLKVGGVVVGSWAGSKNQQNVRTNRGMIRYPINQKFPRGTNNRYRLNGSSGMLATFNQKGAAQRFVNKKKVKPSKDSKKSDEENEEEVEKKIILKDDKKKDVDEVSDQKNKVDDENEKKSVDGKMNGSVDDSEESCDKKDDNSAASDAVVKEQQQQNNKNGKTITNTNNKKSKKNAKVKIDPQVNDESGSEVKA